MQVSKGSNKRKQGFKSLSKYSKYHAAFLSMIDEIVLIKIKTNKLLPHLMQRLQGKVFLRIFINSNSIYIIIQMFFLRKFQQEHPNQPLPLIKLTKQGSYLHLCEKKVRKNDNDKLFSLSGIRMIHRTLYHRSSDLSMIVYIFEYESKTALYW